MLLVHHWELWYTIFNFDSGFTLETKVTFIKTYSQKNLTFKPFMWDVIQAVIFMFLGYLIIVCTRSLVMWVEFWLMPFLTGKIVNKKVVRKEEYDEVVKEREQYFDQYEEQRKNVRIFSSTIDEQTEQIKQKDENLLKQSDEISKAVRDIDVTSKTLERIKSENYTQVEQIKSLTNSKSELEKDIELKRKQISIYYDLYFSDESKEFYTSYEKFPPPITEKVAELKKNNKWQDFLAAGRFLSGGGTISSTVLTDMINFGIAFERGMHEEFTPIGKIIWEYREVLDNYEIY